ncbi:MAG: hypothetical protein AB7I33_14245 [Gemmatimonadales bacterium]
MRVFALLGALMLLVPAGAPKNGEELIQAMHQRYAGKWYRTLTFEQKTTHADGRVETWHEAAVVPGKLRIDIAPIDSGNAIIFRNDSVYAFRGAKQVAARPLVHALMVLGFDVCGDPPATTIAKLKGLNIDLGKLREDTWQGRSVYVVGADAGDTTTNQFWVDQERLLFVRLFQTAPNGTVVEYQFNKYVPLGGGWIAPEVIFYANGQMAQKEEYSDMKANPALPDGLFDPTEYRKPGWVD